ncbi:hypothetical protein HPB52_022985 [Rhipicephalus sanguineus]|uniref:Uncharacterized protein n=1 Tax=Rhipicephalus sanguineus TaxID=34632 RepID=A0A9D4PPU4_RHISA|nr:hypothetical protein HPB52_022985 [Rhipicephalus sanguineus]
MQAPPTPDRCQALGTAPDHGADDQPPHFFRSIEHSRRNCLAHHAHALAPTFRTSKLTAKSFPTLRRNVTSFLMMSSLEEVEFADLRQA